MFMTENCWIGKRGQTPKNDQSWKVIACFEIFDDPVRRHVNEDVGDVEDDQSNIESCPMQVEIFYKAINSGIANVGPVNEGK